MARSRALQGPNAEGAGGVCTSCGGSGVLRTDSAAYRTCLDCLGQGQRPRFEMVFALPGMPRDGRCNLSAWISAAK